MAKIKVGINGFGRIGRLVFRAAMTRNDIEIVGINDLIDVDYMVYMLKYDTMHGRFNGTAEAKDGKLVVNGQAIRVTAEKDPANLKWDEVGAEYVVESTGLFLTKEKAELELKFKELEAFFLKLGSDKLRDSKRRTCSFEDDDGHDVTYTEARTVKIISPAVLKR